MDKNEDCSPDIHQGDQDNISGWEEEQRARASAERILNGIVLVFFLIFLVWLFYFSPASKRPSAPEGESSKVIIRK
jgi:hypothetical protein